MLKKEALLNTNSLRLLESQKISFKVSSKEMYSAAAPEQDCYIDGKRLWRLSMQWAGDSWADGYCDGDPFLRVLFDNEEIPNRKKITISSDKTTVVATYHEGPTGHLEFCAEPVDWTEEDKMLFTGKDDGKHMTFTIEAWGGGKHLRILCIAPSNYSIFEEAA